MCPSRCSVGSECRTCVEQRAQCVLGLVLFQVALRQERWSPLFWNAQPGGQQWVLGRMSHCVCSYHCQFLLPWSLVLIVSCSVAMVAQDVQNVQKQTQSHCLFPPVTMFHVWPCHPVPLPVPISDCVSCVALPPFLLLHVYRSNSHSQAFEPLSAPVPSCQHFVSSPPFSLFILSQVLPSPLFKCSYGFLTLLRSNNRVCKGLPMEGRNAESARR